MRSCCKLRFGI